MRLTWRAYLPLSMNFLVMSFGLGMVLSRIGSGNSLKRIRALGALGETKFLSEDDFISVCNANWWGGWVGGES